MRKITSQFEILKKVSLILILSIISVLLISCSSDEKQLKNEQLLVEEVRTYFFDKVIPIFDKNSTTEITEAVDLGNAHVTTFVNGTNEDETFGFLLISKEKDNYEFSDVEYTKLTKEDPFELVNYTGNIGIKHGINVTLGYINNPDISNVYIYYDNGKMSVIYLEEGQKTFTDILFGEVVKIESIIALSSNEEIIHEVHY